MKGYKKQNEKCQAKTNPPHSIGKTATLKTMSVLKKSHSIQRKPDDKQSKLISVKDENGTKSLMKLNTSVPKKMANVCINRMPSERITRQKPTVQVELKVSYSSFQLLRSIFKSS